MGTTQSEWTPAITDVLTSPELRLQHFEMYVKLCIFMYIHIFLKEI